VKILDPIVSSRRTGWRRHTGLLGLIVFSSATWLTVAQASRPNLSGRWELDKSRSDFGSLPPDESSMELIQHQEPKLTITQVWKNAEGEHTLVWQLTTDGAENLTRQNETEIASRTVWMDGRLVTEWRIKRGAQLSEGSYDRSLSEDRKTLTVGVRQRSASKEIVQYLVFVESTQ
jgi:hypothetical protein